MRLVISVLILLANFGPALAEDLCPDIDKVKPPEGTRMSEDTFEVPAGLDAADKLQAYLNQEKIDYDFSEVVNSFVTKGVILRQQAIAARVALELAKAKNVSKDDMDKADAGAKRGLEAFCGFMVNAVVAE